MSEVGEARIRTLITTEAILSAILLVYLDGHVRAWEKSVENFQFYSITIFLSIIIYNSCIFTLFRSIVLTFQSLFAQTSAERDDLYKVAYDLFLLVLLMASIGIFAAFLYIVRTAIFGTSIAPIQFVAPRWLFLTLFLLLMIYLIILIFRPKWICRGIHYARAISSHLFPLLLRPIYGAHNES